MTEPANNQPKKDYTEVKTSFWDYTTILSSNFFLIFLSLISSTLMARILGSKGLGTFALFQMFVQPMFLYVAGWTSSAVVRYGKEEFVLENKINKVFWGRNIIVFVLLVVIYPIFVVMGGFITQYIGLPSWTIWLLLGYVLVMIYYNYLEYILQVIRRLKQYALLRVLEKLIFVIGLSLIVFRVIPGKVITIILFSMAGMALLTVTGFGLTGKKILFPVKTDKQKINKILLFSLPMLIGGTSSYIINWVDIVVIKKFLSIGEVGVYSLAYQGMNVILQVSMSTIAVLSPLIVALKVQKREDLVVRYAERFIPQGVYLWVISTSLLMLLSQYIVPLLFGHEFAGTVLPFTILLIGLSANILTSLYTPIEHAYELTRFTQKSFILMAVINIVGDIVLIPRIGTPGAAISTAVGFTAGFIYYSYICSRRINVSLKVPLILISISCLSFVFFNFIKIWYGQLLSVVVILCYSLWLAKRLRLFNRDDEKILEHINMPGIIKKVLCKIYRLKIWQVSK